MSLCNHLISWKCLVLLLLTILEGRLLVNSYPSKSNGLTIEYLDQQYIQGAYIDDITKHGILFTSMQNVLSVKSLDGKQLISSEFFTADRLLIVTVINNGFINMNGKDFVISESLATKTIKMSPWQRRKLLRDLYYNKTLFQHEAKTFQTAFQNLLEQPENTLLVKASFALASIGVNGLEYPGALPFFRFTLQLEKLRNQTGQLKFAHEQVDAGNVSHALGDDDECLDECPPCPDMECLGLCGYGCNCWKFVCGDCCYHLGCYEHDLCCREKFFQTKCLFPFGFQCEDHYYCNN